MDPLLNHVLKQNPNPYPTPAPEPGWQPAPVQERPPAPLPPAYRPAGRRDLVFAGILLVFCILAANFYLWGGLGLGATIVTILIFLTGACYLLKYRRRLTAYGIYCVAAYLAGAGAFLISDGGFLHFLLANLLFVLSAVAIMEVMDLRSDKDSSFRNLGDFFRTAFALTFGSFGAAFYGLFHKEDADGSNRPRKLGAPLLGVACALPVLLIVIPLLMSSDEAFSNLLGKLAVDNAAELIFSVILGVFAFLMIYSRLFTLPKTAKKEKGISTSRGIPTSTLCVALSMVSLIYVLYLVSQLAYFFDAFSGLLPKGFTVAEYARKGFFEMCAVCAINLLLIFLAALVSRKKEGRTPLSVRLFSLFLCLFSMVLIATALSKMFLYIDSFGMTHLRILTSVFMVFLAVMFIAVGLRLFIAKVPYMKIAMVTASALLIATCYANVDGIIAEYNVTAYRTDKLDSIDMDTIQALDRDTAVPWLLKLLDDKDPNVVEEAERMLEYAFDEHFEVDAYWKNSKYISVYEDKGIDWRAYNLAYARAYELLLDWGSEKFTENAN